MSSRVLANSVVYRAVAGMLSLFRQGVQHLGMLAQRIDAAAGRARRAPIDADDEARVREVLAGSRLVRAIDAAIDVPPRAWRSSALRAWLQPKAREFRSLPAADQVRLAGWALMIATITHVALVVALGEAVGWPTWAAWLSFVAVLCVPVLWPDGVVAAWSNRSPWVRRFLREPGPWR